MNIDETKIEDAITKRTRVIVCVHYAGVGCEMDVIMDIARRHNLVVVEDAAQGIISTYKKRALGSIGDIGTFSFHETKNIMSGNGGGLLLRDEELLQRAEIIREKGTDRKKFERGQVDKYTWHDVRSAYLPGEVMAAFLWAQMEEAEQITTSRLEKWDRYHSALKCLEDKGMVRRPIIPKECMHNAHMYYLLLPDHIIQKQFISFLYKREISAIFHYIPLHNSPMGLTHSRTHYELDHTVRISDRLVRLPLFMEFTEQ